MDLAFIDLRCSPVARSGSHLPVVSSRPYHPVETITRPPGSTKFPLYPCRAKTASTKADISNCLVDARRVELRSKMTTIRVSNEILWSDRWVTLPLKTGLEDQRLSFRPLSLKTKYSVVNRSCGLSPLLPPRSFVGPVQKAVQTLVGDLRIKLRVFCAQDRRIITFPIPENFTLPVSRFAGLRARTLARRPVTSAIRPSARISQHGQPAFLPRYEDV